MKIETVGDLLTSCAKGWGKEKINISFSHVLMLAHPFLKTTSVYIQATHGELGHI